MVYKCIDEGAYAFVVLYRIKYGIQNLTVSSRTNAGKKYTHAGNSCFVTKIVASLGLFEMGMPERNFHVCKEVWEKAEFLSRSFNDSFRAIVDQP